MNWNKFEDAGPPKKGTPCWVYKPNNPTVNSGLTNGLTYTKLLCLGVLTQSLQEKVGQKKMVGKLLRIGLTARNQRRISNAASKRST